MSQAMSEESDNGGDPLARIADALERLAPQPEPVADLKSSPAFVFASDRLRAVERLDAPSLELLRGIDEQKERVVTNVLRLAQGHAAHDMLLWGARGMGKSALLRSAVKSAQKQHPGALALVQVSQDALSGLADLFALLGPHERRFLVFIDDLGFEDDDGSGPRQLRSWLEGGVEARPGNVRLAVTSNWRAIVARHQSEQDDPVNPRDAVDDRLALADRFGMSIGFHNCSQDDYLEIIGAYASQYGLDWDRGDALEWSRRRGGRSGRVAWQYVVELAGRAGRAL
jgi:predicted AAA+ superfamily ATPase